ncbi:phosphatidylserine/phosphatidylglycerophosphate/cardiolipin synthase family protein [Terribacillus sp. DMT04]|uniref:phospholipase D-like domain-containing protein n=1 Tax=Terribacillus sp. DMT04 TaxID=2850441 RepID=UPI001C2C5C84|nr:phospholipase D-like domain-containing protein [Terribacillus sp. DMT04]QXE01178.1 cardiolipin synthase [Terribacillus sp. DMT04]
MSIFFLVLALFLLFAGLVLIDLLLGKKQSKRMAVNRLIGHKQAFVSLFGDGISFYNALIRDIKAAKHSVDIQFFLVKWDEPTQQLTELLKQRAQEGIEIRFLLDRIGGYRLPRKERRLLRQAGVMLRFANIPRFPYLLYNLNFRNHRKVTIIDQRTVYVGGFNIGKEYLSKEPRFGFWRDAVVKLEGEAVYTFVQVFASDWGHHFPTFPKEAPALDGAQVEIVITESDGYEDWLLHQIHQAKRYLYIGTPYCVPTKRIEAALKRASDRGVDVRLLLPYKVDHYIVNQVSFHFARRLLRYGIRVNLYHNGFYHAKILLSDGERCAVGSANLDGRSLLINKELTLTIRENDLFYAQLLELWKKDEKASVSASLAVMQERRLLAKLTGILFRPLRHYL